MGRSKEGQELMTSATTLVVIPTYNESDNVVGVIGAALAASSDLDVLLVDDGSPDGTADLADATGESRVRVLRRSGKKGLGSAYVAGFLLGLGGDYKRFVEMDADLSHDPAFIPVLVERTATCDLAIGSRYVSGGKVQGWPRSRHLLSRAGNLYVRALLGLGIADSTSGFRCYRREVLERIGLATISSEGYAFQIEMAYRTVRAGFSVCEVPITFVERRAGSSKMSRAIVGEATVSVALWALRRITGGPRS